MLNGNSLIAGNWIASRETFTNSPLTGEPDRFSAGTPDLVNRACEAAEDAFWSYGYSKIAERAEFLREVGRQIDAYGDAITDIGSKETGLPGARLEGERARTVAQLNLFADHIEAGDHLDRRSETALPDREPLPRPELRMVQRPVGPVAIFGASNFPLAFSTAGGDTASALAAGCPVVVKGHPAHPGIADLVAQAFDKAIRLIDVHAGVFNQIQDGGNIVGETLVKHPLIRAVGFTGSLKAGRALFEICAGRPEPIPFFGELGSINPMFILPAALQARARDIAEGWAASLTMGAGQYCTNPGLAVVVDGQGADEFINAAATALSQIGPQTMLTDGIADAYRNGCEMVAGAADTEVLTCSKAEGRSAAPYLATTSVASWLAQDKLKHEVFGPFGIIVRVSNIEEVLTLARSLDGQLTCTLQLDVGDDDAARRLMPILERKAGRVLANGFPTGVEVCGSMVHTGPYPASTNVSATAVGTMAIRRFLRPVCYQNIPEDLLPQEFRG